MKITVCSYAWGEHTKISDVTFPRWRTYCNIHGYELVTYWPEPKEGEAWPKPRMILEHMKNCDLLMWVDCDTVPVNQLHKAEHIWKTHGNYKPIVLTADMYGLNCGVMLISNCPVAEQFWHAVLEVGYKMYAGNAWDEQEAVIRFAHQHPYRNHVGVINQSCMNSYLNAEYNRPEGWSGGYVEGDFIIHFPGLPIERRVELAKEYAGKSDAFAAVELALRTPLPPTASPS